MVLFTANTKELLTVLKNMSAGLNSKSKKALNTTCELTITDGKISFIVPGAEFYLNCVTEGTAKVAFSFLYFIHIVKSLKNYEAEFRIADNEMSVGTITFKVNTCFFENDTILRRIDLPLNYTDIHLLHLANGNYTKEELEFNKMLPKIIEAKQRLETSIIKAHKLVEMYGIKYSEIEKIVMDKFKSTRSNPQTELFPTQ